MLSSVFIFLYMIVGYAIGVWVRRLTVAHGYEPAPTYRLVSQAFLFLFSFLGLRIIYSLLTTHLVTETILFGVISSGLVYIGAYTLGYTTFSSQG